MDLSHLKPSTAPVLIDETELTMRTLSIVQHGALASALAKLNLKPLLDAVGPMFASAEAGGASFIRQIIDHGADLFRAGLEAVGKESAAELAVLCGVLLDREVNFDLAKKAGAIIATVGPETEDGRYISSDHLRRWIATSITPSQAVHAITQAVKLTDYATLGKALLAMIPRTGTPTAPTNGEAPIAG